MLYHHAASFRHSTPAQAMRPPFLGGGYHAQPNGHHNMYHVPNHHYYQHHHHQQPSRRAPFGLPPVGNHFSQYQSTPVASLTRPSARGTDDSQGLFHLNSKQGEEEDSPRSPSPPPPPPQSLQQSVYSSSSADRKAILGNGRKLALEENATPSNSFGRALQDSQRQNSLNALNEGKNEAQMGHKDSTSKEARLVKTPSVQDASLLLGLRSSAKKEGAAAATPELPKTTGVTTSVKKTAVKSPISIPENYPTRLARRNDSIHLNSLHCFIRSELLELFVIEESKDSNKPNSMAGRIGLQCVHCAKNRPNDPKRRNEATMAVFYPKSVSEIYRLVTNWTRCHLRKCRNLPPDVRAHWETLRATDKTRGKTNYWTDSAYALGLVDCTKTRAGGVRFRPSQGR